MLGIAATEPALTDASTKLQPNSAVAAREFRRSILTFLLVFVAACVLFFSELGSYPLFNPDEALYAEPAREMLETGDYITTTLNYVVRFTKPPLFIWAQTLAYQVFGVNEFAARFVGAACAALLVALTYVFTELYVSRKVAIVSSLMLASAPLFVGTAREAITDMPLSLLLGACLMSFFHAYEQKKSGWCWAGYLFIGLAVMTKGPVGLILPVAILGTYHLLRWDVWQALKFYRPWFGLLIVAAIAVPWFAVEIAITKGAYYYEFIVRENFQRFTSVVDHPAPWWYHIAAVAGGLLPWSVLLPPAIFLAAKSWRAPEQRVLLFCLCWTVVTVVFFSASVSKLLPYTVPAFPACAILMGAYLRSTVANKSRLGLMIPFGIIAVSFGTALFLVPLIVPKLKEAPVELITIARAGLISLFVSALASMFLVWRQKLQASIAFFLAAFYCCVLGFGVSALSSVSDHWEGSLPAYARFAGISKWPVFVYHMRKPSVTFYARRQVVIPLGDELEQALQQTNGAYIISKKKELDYLLTLPRCKLVSANGLYVLVVQTRMEGASSTYKPILRPM